MPLVAFTLIALFIIGTGLWALGEVPKPTLVDQWRRSQVARATPRYQRSVGRYVFCERTNRWRDRETRRFVKASIALATA